MIPQERLKKLVRQLEMSPRSKLLPQPEDSVEEVLLESEIDGIRYYLIRCRPQVLANGIDHPIHLSPREQAIADLVAQGLPNKCIARELDISPWTVATYLRRIFRKLDVTSRAAMTARLFEAKLRLQ